MINTYLTRSIKLVGCVCKLELTLYIIIQIIESFTPTFATHNAKNFKRLTNTCEYNP